MNTFSKTEIAGIILLLSVLGMELTIDHIQIKEQSVSLNIVHILLVLFTIGIISTLIYNRNALSFQAKKLKEILKTLIKNTVSGSILDILFVVFFLLHLTWIPDSIYAYVQGEKSLLHPIIYLSGMLFAIMTKPVIAKADLLDPLVVLTGISNISERTISTILAPFDKCRTADIYDSEKIEKIIIFIDPDIKFSPEGLEEKGIHEDILIKCGSFDNSDMQFKQERVKDILESLFKAITVGRSIDVTLIECSYEKIQHAFDIISFQVNELLFDKYKDEHLLFNLTPGNKNISIALALNSFQGRRRTCYIQQNTKDFEIEELDVFKMKDIFTELIN